MARGKVVRGKAKRRRRKGRYAFLLKIFSFAVGVIALIAALTMFFKMEQIVITGNDRYSQEEVLLASGLKVGDNLYLMNKFAVKERIFSALPYVETVAIHRQLPDTLVIELKECHVAATLEGGDSLWLLGLVDGKGKVLEEVGSPVQGCPSVMGLRLLEPSVGAAPRFREDMAERAAALLSLLWEADQRHIIPEISYVDLTDETVLTFSYLDRFTVKLPWDADMNYKISSLIAVVQYLEENENGVIDLTAENKASFIPQT